MQECPFKQQQQKQRCHTAACACNSTPQQDHHHQEQWHTSQSMEDISQSMPGTSTKLSQTPKKAKLPEPKELKRRGYHNGTYYALERDETVLEAHDTPESDAVVRLCSAVACSAALFNSSAANEDSASTFSVSAATLADSSAIFAASEAAVSATAARAGCAGGFLDMRRRDEAVFLLPGVKMESTWRRPCYSYNAFLQKCSKCALHVGMMSGTCDVRSGLIDVRVGS